MKRLFLLIIFPVAQIAFSIIIGYFALSLAAPSSSVRSGVVYAGVDFSGMDVPEAAAAIRKINDSQTSKGLAGFTYNEIEFVFHFNEISLAAEFPNLESSLTDKDSPSYLNSLLTAFTRNYGVGPIPLYYADAEAFRSKLYRMKTYIDKDPINADISYSRREGIVRSSSEQGVYLDIDGQFDLFYEVFLSNPFKPFVIDSNNEKSDMMLIIEEPRVADSMLADIDTVLADIRAHVPERYDISLITDAAEAVNKVWAPRNGAAFAPVSFMRYIGEAGLQSDIPAREYDFVASALMHALLVSGVDYSMMEANSLGGLDGMPETETETNANAGSGAYTDTDNEYIYGGVPGFDIKNLYISGGEAGDTQSQDFKFTNSLDGSIVIFAFVEDGELSIVIAGNSKFAGRRAAPYEITSEITDGYANLYRGGSKIAEKALY